MGDLVRLSVSLERKLYENLESLVRDSGYANRSEFVRDLIRDRLVSREWSADREVAATVTLIYNHHQHHLSERLTSLQHRHHDTILATTHVHLDRHLCAEMILMRGQAVEVRQLAEEMKSQKGVLHGVCSMTSTGRNLS